MSAAKELRLAREAQQRLRSALQALSIMPAPPEPLSPSVLTSRLRNLEAAAAPLLEAIDVTKTALAAAEHERVRTLADASGGPSWGRRPPAIADAAAALEWVANRAFHDGGRVRFTIIDRTDPHDWSARASAAVAEIRPGLLVGGDLGATLLRNWPATRAGGRKALGAPGLARLIGGPAAEVTLNARVAQLERDLRQRRWREEAVYLAAHAAYTDDEAARRFRGANSHHAEESDEALRAVLEKLARETGCADVADADARLRLVDSLQDHLWYEDFTRARSAGAGSVVRLIHLLEQVSRSRGGVAKIDDVVRRLRDPDGDSPRVMFGT